MSGYLVLVYFFPLGPGILQERYFEIETFLCLDWKDAHWVCICFWFWLLPNLCLPSVSHFRHIMAMAFPACLLGFDDPAVFLNIDLIYSTNVWRNESRTSRLFVCLRCRLSLEEEYHICKLCPTPTLLQVFPPRG